MNFSTSKLSLLLSSLLVLGACSKGQEEETPTEQGPAEGEGGDEQGSEAAAEAEAPDLSDAVAAVDGQPVLTTSELEAQLARLVERYEMQASRPPTDGRWRNQRRRRLVHSAVESYLVTSFVESNMPEIADDELNEFVRGKIAHVFDDERIFERFLQNQGYTRETYMQEQRMLLAEDKILSERGTLDPTDAEVNAFYMENQDRWQAGERVHVRNITARVRPNADDIAWTEALNRVTEARSALLQGADFAELAQESSDSADRVRGGDMGWIVRGQRAQLVNDGVEEVLFSVPVGQVTEPIRTTLGYQIFLVEDRRAEGVRQIDEVRDVVRAPLRNRNRERLRRELVRELTATQSVEWFEENWALESEEGGTAIDATNALEAAGVAPGGATAAPTGEQAATQQ